MFRRSKTHRQPHATERAEAQEIARLNGQIERLERALKDLIDASDDVLIDVREAEFEREYITRPSSAGFSAAWTSFAPTSGSEADENFFEAGQIDQRSRRWLLTPK